MLKGKVNAALHLLSRDKNGGVLDDLIPMGIRQIVQQTTCDVLMEKHPKGKPALDDALLHIRSNNVITQSSLSKKKQEKLLDK